MKARPVLLLLSSVLLLCSAAPDLQPVTCNEDGGAAAARLAMHDINKNHRHGYKFKLQNINATVMVQVKGGEGCTMELQLDLAETDCPHFSPKCFENCDVRADGERAVVANCSVFISVKSGDASVDSYKCDTRQEMTNMAMARACPDCPTLLSLRSPEGLASIHGAIQKINQNQSNANYYILEDVGRILSGYIPDEGMYYVSKFFMVETRCPFGSRIAIPACKALPPARARRAYCRLFSIQNGPPADPTCEYFPASTNDGDDQDPATSDADSQHGPPDHAQGPPDHARGPPDQAQGPPDHARGPPDHARGPPDHAHCKGALPNSDPAIHPICPKPLAEQQVEPSSDQS